MKWKYVFFLVIFLSSFSLTWSQDLVHWGVKFGFDIPTNKKDFNVHLKYNKSVNYNVGFQLRVGDRFFGQAGIDYIINKCTLNFQDTISSIESIELGYFAIPLQAGFQIIQSKHTVFRAILGLQYRSLIRLTKNDMNVEKTDFQIHNLDCIGGLGLDLYSFTLDVGCRKSIHPIMPGSEHYRNMVTLSAGLIF